MNILTEPYTDLLRHIPQSGRHITAQVTNDAIVVYQAYRPSIAAN